METFVFERQVLFRVDILSVTLDLSVPGPRVGWRTKSSLINRILGLSDPESPESKSFYDV